ncbi:MAG: 50S ribosomal protein L13 [Candidatus Zixiibacteriota bacterium]
MKTFIPKVSDLDRKWYVIDLKDQILGRAAVRIADILRGKDKPYFSPHMDCGDHVIVINARHARMTGKKPDQKRYHRYTGYPGGLRTRTFAQMKERFPERLVEKTIKGMIPHTKLGSQVYRKLHVYADDHHPHRAQKPVELKLG